MRRLISLAVLLAGIALLNAGCMEHLAAAPGYPGFQPVPAVYTETEQAPWDECLGECRAHIAQGICPSAPAFNPRDPRGLMALMAFESRQAFEEQVHGRCGGQVVRQVAWNNQSHGEQRGRRHRTEHPFKGMSDQYRCWVDKEGGRHKVDRDDPRATGWCFGTAVNEND